MPLSFAMGDTFGIVQGSLETDTQVYFKVYAQDEFLFDSPKVVAKNDVFATTVTIPSIYSSVQITPVIDTVPLSGSFILSSGETLEVNLVGTLIDSTLKPSSSSSSKFSFQPKENKEKIEDLQQGEYEEYEEEIDISPIPIVPQNDLSASESILPALDTIQNKEHSLVATKEFPSFQEDNSFLEKVDDLFLRPLMLLTMGVLACILLVLIIRREHTRSKYL